MTRLRFVLLAAATAGLSACSTIDVPDLGMNLPEFRESLANLDSAYPQAEELPGAPQGVRSDAEWDASAREMQALRQGFAVPDAEPALSDAEFEARFRDAQNYADAYKDDDPQ